MIEAAIRTYYLANGTISGLIGTKFHWGKVPQATAAPYVRASLINDRTYHALNGDTTGLYDRLFQVSIFADTFDKAATIRDAFIARTAAVTSGSITNVVTIRHEDTRSLTEESNNLALIHIAMDFRVIFKQ